MEASELQKICSGNIKKYRLLNNYTQQYLAELADISVGYLCDLESGKKWGTAETITKLAKALKIEPYQMYFKHEEISDTSLYSDLLLLSQDMKEYIDLKITSLIEKNNL